MRLVPAGEFTMGNDADDALAECQKFRSDCKKDWFIDEEPPHLVYLDAFYMDTYEVTNAAYKACEEAGVCDRPRKTRSSTRSSYYGDSQYDDYPVIFVDWYQAGAYCRWRGGSLPTEAQWEKAARGTEGHTYPWGEGIDCSRANYGGCGDGDTTKVGSYESGLSPNGMYDMAGNVWEWVADWYDSGYYGTLAEGVRDPTGPGSGEYRVMRGGSWYDVNGKDLRVSDRRGLNPDLEDSNHSNIGFRCVRSSP